ncbi:M20/M25/M40 family metallo-hydrolase [Streptomyces sp. ODS28]|uniref:M20/M25/M40 family metallo-hydrolase n=1 Tax=Streptomyces sp. ODS28 TaxID=3136688 RepID=UPI0031E7C76C
MAQSGTGNSVPGRDRLADRLAREVTERGGFRHLRALQNAADENGGNRGAGTPGYAASAAYVTSRLTAAGYRVRYQRFAFPDFLPVRETAAETAPVRRRLHPLMARFSPPTPPGGLRAPLAVLPGQGCTAEEYERAGARSRIALVRGEECELTVKQRAAARAGVRAVLMNVGAPGPTMNLRYRMKPPTAGLIPSAALSRGESELLAADAARGPGPVSLHLTLRGRHVRTSTFNVLADTPTGRPDRTVVLGAHLDSVPEGPGADDNASSAAMVLETALRLAHHWPEVRHRVRFAFWGAEERGLVGSQHYVDRLDAAGRRDQALDLNFETIGAPNYARLVYDGDDSEGTGAGQGPPGSAAIEREFTGYFAARGLPTAALDFDGRSDFGPFIAAGIPAGGGSGGYNHLKTPAWQRLFGGTAGQYLDPCYHQTCDTADGISRTLFGQFGAAMAHATGRFAQDLGGVPDVRRRR